MISEFSKEKVFWSRTMNINLVNFIKNKPVIWNPKHPKYTSVNIRDKTYAEFAAKYGNEFTGQAVKDRWTNIRSTYTFYLRKVNSSKAKGNGEAYKVRWHLWDACKFLSKIGKLSKLEVETDKNDSKDNITENEESSDNDIIQDNETNLNTTCENIANMIANLFKGMQNGVLNSESSRYEHIGNLVAEKLSLKDSYEAARLTSKIMNILLLYDENNPKNPNNMDIKCEFYDEEKVLDP